MGAMGWGQGLGAERRDGAGDYGLDGGGGAETEGAWQERCCVDTKSAAGGENSSLGLESG